MRIVTRPLTTPRSASSQGAPSSSPRPPPRVGSWPLPPSSRPPFPRPTAPGSRLPCRSTSSSRSTTSRPVLERSIRRLHRFLDAEFPFTLADRDRRQREHRRHAGDRRACSRGSSAACRCCGSSARAAGARCAPPGRRATPASSRTWTSTSRRTCGRCCRSWRRCSPATRDLADRDAAGPRRPRRAGPEARAHLARLQRDPAHRAARALLRRPVRLQGRPREALAAAAAGGPRRRLVLRHRAARPGPAPRAADPRGAGRLDRRPGLAR